MKKVPPLTRRRRFLARQRAHGKTRPDPLRIMVGNCMSVSTGPVHAERIFFAHLAAAVDKDCAVVLLSECADFRASAQGWETYQPGDLGSPESGTLVAVRSDRAQIVDRARIVGSAETSEGDGIRERSIVRAWLAVDRDTPAVWMPWVSSGHAPPPRAPRARAKFMARFARVGGIRGGDLNLAAAVVARTLGMCRVHGTGVICLAVPRWIPSRMVASVGPLAGADHRSLIVECWPEKQP